jgi:hypothetical protein
VVRRRFRQKISIARHQVILGNDADRVPEFSQDRQTSLFSV